MAQHNDIDIGSDEIREDLTETINGSDEIVERGHNVSATASDQLRIKRSELSTKNMASDKDQTDRREVVVKPLLSEKVSCEFDLMTKSVAGGYECPWEKFQRPGALDLLKWKMQSYEHIPCEKILEETLPVKKINILNDPPFGKTRVTWIGHATLLVELDGITVLTDPVFGSHASAPLQFSIMPCKRYRPAACQVTDIPHLDAVIISHDHYDHLETDAVVALKAKFPNVHWFVPMGTKTWLEKKGCKTNVTELKWWQEATLGGTIRFVCTPSQHWCQRSPIDLNTRLWCSWVIKGPSQTFYFGGDTGYFKPLFETIGMRYSPINLAAIPIGAYNPRFITKYQHVNPEEAVSIHEDIGSQISIGIHWGTFQLTNEHYLEPPHRVEKAMKAMKAVKAMTDRCLDCNKFICLNIGETWTVGDEREEPQFMKQKVPIKYEKT